MSSSTSASIASSSTKPPTWYWQADDRSWVAYPEELSNFVESVYQGYLQVFHQNAYLKSIRQEEYAQKPATRSFEVNGATYEIRLGDGSVVDTSRFTQRNQKSGISRPIFRVVDVPVVDVRLLKLQGIENELVAKLEELNQRGVKVAEQITATQNTLAQVRADMKAVSERSPSPIPLEFPVQSSTDSSSCQCSADADATSDSGIKIEASAECKDACMN